MLVFYFTDLLLTLKVLPFFVVNVFDFVCLCIIDAPVECKC